MISHYFFQSQERLLFVFKSNLPELEALQVLILFFKKANEFLSIALVFCSCFFVVVFKTFIRPIIVHFSFIVISCTRNSMRSSMRHEVIIWLFGKLFEKITLCFVLSLYDKNRFIFTIYFYIVCLVLYSWNVCFL